jgi:hypothetical protein
MIMVEEYSKLGTSFLKTSVKIWLTALRQVIEDRTLRVVK